MKKLLSIVSIGVSVVLSLVGLLAFDINSASAQEVPAGPPIIVKIESVNVDTVKMMIVADVLFTNNTDKFIGHLENRMQVFKGEALAIEGDLFDPLVYYGIAESSLEELAPREEKEVQISYTIPNNFNPGNYFFKVFTNDKENLYYGLDYTSKPTMVNIGEGGMLSSEVEYYFRTTNGDDFPLYGFQIPVSDVPSIIVPLKDNPEIEKYLLKNKIYAVANIAPSADPSSVVKTYDSKELSITTDTKFGKVLEYKLTAWPEMKGDTYNVRLSLQDASGNVLIQPFLSRWWVDGTIIRIRDIESETNAYKAGENLDISVNHLSLDVASPDGYKMSVDLFDTEGTKVSFSKNINLNNDLQVTSFNDEKISQDFMVSKIVATISDSAGKVAYSIEKNLDVSKVYSKTIQATPVWAFVLANKTLVSVLVIILVLLGIVLAFKFRGTKIMTFTLLVLALIIIFGLYYMVFADRYVTLDLNSNTASVLAQRLPPRLPPPSPLPGGMPSGGTTGDTAPLNASFWQSGGCNVFVAVSCSYCINGVSFSISTGGSGSFSASDNNDGTTRGPFGVSWGSTNSTAVFSSGSHCSGTVRSISISGCDNPAPVVVPSAVCGNGVVEGSESCDLGSSNGSCPSTCSTSCTANSCGGGGTCGNGVVEGSESCDLGSNNGSCPSTCSSSCVANSCNDGDDVDDDDNPNNGSNPTSNPNKSGASTFSDCVISMSPQYSSVNIGTNTTWLVTSNTNLSNYSVIWWVSEDGGVTFNQDISSSGLTLNKIFTTIGQKFVSAWVASSTNSLINGFCKGSISNANTGDLYLDIDSVLTGGNIVEI